MGQEVSDCENTSFLKNFKTMKLIQAPLPPVLNIIDNQQSFSLGGFTDIEGFTALMNK